MTKKIIYKFKNPNYNSNNQENEWIPLWIYNDGDSNRIELSVYVFLDSNRLINLSDFVDNITNSDKVSNTFWQPASQSNTGYVPVVPTTGNSGMFLYADNNGQVRWATAKYYFNEINPVVTPLLVKDNYNNNDNDRILVNRENSQNDFILNLNKFLCGINISINSAPIKRDVTSDPIVEEQTD